MAAFSPEDVRRITAELVAVRSVSPGLRAETRCGELLASRMPPRLEHGIWPTPDGRPVVWARARGTGRVAGAPGVLLLGHYDTVGVEEYRALDDSSGEAVAFDPGRLRTLVIERLARGALPAEVAADAEEERRTPGTWMFGRGALDMKSGLAAGIAALASLDEAGAPGDVMLVATPDEEHESAGMFTAVTSLARLARTGEFKPLGALNLDYGVRPAAYTGVLGKMLAGVWVLGVAGHASDRGRGADAARLAAEIATRVTRSESLRHLLAAPPALLRLRDRKVGYDVQTVGEAELQLNCMLSVAQPADVLRMLAEEVRAAMAAATTGSTRVIEWREIAMHDGGHAVAGEGDVRARCLERVRHAAFAAGLEAPAAVVFPMPPFYPAASVSGSALAAAAEAVAREAGLALPGPFPSISDASYLRWSESADAIVAAIPNARDDLALPLEAMRALDLDVVNLGPWGHDAHGLYERVNAPYAFERLPQLIEAVVRRAIDAA